ncbi:hypothetical protein AgCh_009984 [Apium graveolens]
MSENDPNLNYHIIFDIHRINDLSTASVLDKRRKPRPDYEEEEDIVESDVEIEVVGLDNAPMKKESISLSYQVSQSNTDAVLYSLGTTGQVKGVELIHHNLIAITSSYQRVRSKIMKFGMY